MAACCSGCWGAISGTSQCRQLQKDDGSLNLRYYLFDWDDNIVNMPTKIWLEDQACQPVLLSTAEFAKRRAEVGKTLHPPNGNFGEAFREFCDETGDFEGDLRRAMAGTAWQGPAFEDFKRAVIEGRLFGIVTARGHGETTLRCATKNFVGAILSSAERQEMLQSLRAYRKLSSAQTSDEDTINRYFDKCFFAGVTNPEFMRVSCVANPEEGKKHAVRTFVKATMDANLVDFAGCKISSIAFGMSDDDAKNVQAIEELMRDELSPAYPDVKFVPFDTGSGQVDRRQSHLVWRAGA